MANASSSAMSSNWPTTRLIASMSRCKRLGDALIVQRFHAGTQNAERRAQLMRGVRGEFALHPKALVEPIQRLVDRGHQRADLAWNFAKRQAHIGARGADLLGDFGGLPQRPQRAAEDRDIGDQEHQ